MDKKKTFLFLELIIFFSMGIITFLEIIKFELFEKTFSFLQPYIGWFIGLSFGFVFLGFLNTLTRKFKIGLIEKRKEYFSIFLINLCLSFTLVTFIKVIAISFFSKFFIYFHVLFLQWILILYVMFKLKNNYEISQNYLIINELIVLFYTVIIMIFVL